MAVYIKQDIKSLVIDQVLLEYSGLPPVVSFTIMD